MRLKLLQKRAIQKTAEAIVYSLDNTIAGKITKKLKRFTTKQFRDSYK